jgi:hypothetical protein
VQPLPPGTSAIPALTRVATNKWNCRSGVSSVWSTHQNAPPSKPFDAIGPEPNKANCKAAQDFQFSFLYLLTVRTGQFVAHEDVGMILQIPTDRGQMPYHFNAILPEAIGRTDTREHQ